MHYFRITREFQMTLNEQIWAFYVFFISFKILLEFYKLSDTMKSKKTDWKKFNQLWKKIHRNILLTKVSGFKYFGFLEIFLKYISFFSRSYRCLWASHCLNFIKKQENGTLYIIFPANLNIFARNKKVKYTIILIKFDFDTFLKNSISCWKFWNLCF